MPFTVIDCEQRSSDWHKARVGRLTGSVAKDMLAKGKGKEESVGRRDLRVRLIAERLTGEPQESGYSNAAMRWGSDMEPNAIAFYEAVTGSLVGRTGFLAHTEVMAGCSLDGHIDNFKGIVELKCPLTATHLGYMRTGGSEKYLPQIMHNLWVSGAEWCDFVSFDPRLPENMRLYIKRYEREKLDLVGYEISARAFLTEVEHEMKQLEKM